MCDVYKKQQGGEESPHWHRSTAGFYMTRAVPIVTASARVADVRAQIHTAVRTFKTVDYVYVVDRRDVFVGILSYRTLLSASSTASVRSVCTSSPLFTITPDSPADYAAHLSLHHTVASIAVVNKSRKLLGVISAEGIVRILHRRRIEALFHRSGVASEHTFDTVVETPLLQSVRHRILWLFLGMIGGLLAANIIGSFEQTLERNLLLAAFIPLVVYLADAVRTQLEAFTIRDLALFQNSSRSSYFFRQLAIVVIISIVLGTVAFFVSFLMYREVSISAVLALSIISASTISVVTGILVPFFFRTFSSDPANASGPIGTIIQDILSVSVYFLIATWLL